MGYYLVKPLSPKTCKKLFSFSQIQIGRKISSNNQIQSLGEIRDAILDVGGIRFGTYYSLFEWFNPLYLRDRENNGSTTDYVEVKIEPFHGEQLYTIEFLDPLF